ncbi:MAG: two-component system regulatory protein YycI [Dethiobacter sp.]|mgnify:CR=1 FL=1|nr:two-component system regulatory protein YycI [Dethiobacter sp.]MCL4463466.1 two-component system regulatory protein YycI [Bacillota bacterium]MCL5993345.1 two-component system regulatory protein YycI [Bacillota bacterium]
MDLSKAKTILILAFLLLNLFLSYRLLLGPQPLQAGHALSGEDLEKVRALLTAAGYEPAVPIPRQAPRLSLLHVSRKSQADAAWAEMFLGAGVPEAVIANGLTVFTKDGNSVTVAPSGQVVFRSAATRKKSLANMEEDRHLAELFLKENGLWWEDLKLDFSWPRRAEGGSFFRFVQTYQGFPLFFSTVEVLVAAGQVREVKLYRVVSEGFSPTELQVISALEAVQIFVEQPPVLPAQKIADISLGYFSEDYDAERWETVPVWRIAGTDGTAVYVNAFTGEVETSVLK